MDKVNIAVFSPQLYPCDIGGYEIFNYYFIKGLAGRGHKIWVITCCDYDWGNENIINIKISRRTLLLISPSITLNTILKLKKLRKKIDIIHVPYTSNSSLIYPILISKKIFKLYYIITIHGGGMHPWKRKTLQKSFFQKSSDIVAVSNIIKEEYESRTNRKIKTILPLIPFNKSTIPKDELRNRYGFKISDTIILSLGSIKKIKGSDVLLKSFLQLDKKYIEKYNLKLLYVGDGPMKQSLEKIVNKKDFHKYVKFYGKLPYEQVSEVYKLVDIYVIPSLFEGTPKSLLEAMYNGLPIIGSDTNGINNIINDGENGLIFKVSSDKDLVIKLKQIIENEKLREELGKDAITHVKNNYDYKTTLSEYIEVYENIKN